MASDDISRIYTFITGTAIKQSEVGEELDQLIATINTKAGRGVNNIMTGNNTFSGSNTFSGVNTFSDAVNLNGAVTFADVSGGRTIEGINLDDGVLNIPTSASTPSPLSDGDIYRLSADDTYRIKTPQGLYALTSAYGGYTNLTSGTPIIGKNENSGFINLGAVTGVTLVDPIAATLGQAWHCTFRYSGATPILITPNAPALIDGATSLKIYPGEGFKVFCDDTDFYTVGRKTDSVLLGTITASNQATVDFGSSFLSNDFENYELVIKGVHVVNSDARLMMRLSESATFKSGAADYYILNQTRIPVTSAQGTGGSTSGIEFSHASAGYGLPTDAERGASLFLSVKKRNDATERILVTGRYCGWRSGGTQFFSDCFGSSNAAFLCDGFQFLTTNGNIQGGTFSLYGRKG